MRIFFSLLISYFSSFVLAQTIPPGEYNAGGYGVLKIDKTKNGQTPYYLFSLGANGHMCEIEGNIQNDKSVLSVGSDNKPCRIDFTRKAGKIIVSFEDRYIDACRGFCGVRAGFTGEYFDVPKFCTEKAIEARQKNGQEAYREKKYTKARTDFRFILNKCRGFLDWRLEGSVRNDLAITESKLNNRTGCWAALKPYQKDIKQPDNDVGSFSGLADYTDYLAIIKAARINAKWCERAK